MLECVEANTYLFADDTKIFIQIKTEEDRKHLQDDLDKLQQWSDTWLLKFHPSKCKVMSISNKRLTEVTTTYYLHDQDRKPVELSRWGRERIKDYDWWQSKFWQTHTTTSQQSQ